MMNPQPTNTEQTKGLGEILAIGSKKPETDLLTQSLANTLLLSTVAGSAIDVAIPVPLGPTSSAMFSAIAYSFIKKCKNPSPFDSITFTRNTQEGKVSASVRSFLDEYGRGGQTAILTSAAVLAAAVPATSANIGGVIGAHGGIPGFLAGYGLGAAAGYTFAFIAPIFIIIITNCVENPKERVNRLRFEELKNDNSYSSLILSSIKNTKIIQGDGVSKLENIYLNFKNSESESELKALSLKEFTKLVKALSIESEGLSSLYEEHKKAKNEQLSQMFKQLEKSESIDDITKTLKTNYKAYYHTDKDPSLPDLLRFIAKHSRFTDQQSNSDFFKTLKNQFSQDQHIQETRELHGKIENALLSSYLQQEGNNFDKALLDTIDKKLRQNTTFTGFDDEKMWSNIEPYFKENNMQDGINFCKKYQESPERMKIFFNNTSIAKHLNFDVKEEAVKEGPSGFCSFCSCDPCHSMGEQEVTI